MRVNIGEVNVISPYGKLNVKFHPTQGFVIKGGTPNFANRTSRINVTGFDTAMLSIAIRLAGSSEKVTHNDRQMAAHAVAKVTELAGIVPQIHGYYCVLK